MTVLSNNETIFNDNARITDPASARRFLTQLDRIRWAARFLPIAPAVFPNQNIYYILGHDDVISALSNDSTFATPFKAAMQKFDSKGEVSLLGFDQNEDAQYQKNLCQVMRAMPLDMAARMGESAAGETNRILQQKGTRLDLMKDLLNPVTLKVTQEAYGMTFRDPDAFLKWTMSIVNFVFGKPGGGAYKLRAALAAGALIDQEIQSNIKKRKSHKDTVLRTMLANRIKAERIQPTLAALLVGGMPTITQAGYNIMKVLLANRDAMAMTVAAARHDDDSLRLCLREALRFSPVLPVIFRKYVVPSKVNRDPADPAEAAAVAGAGGLVDWLGRPIPSGADVGIFCLTANFDARRVASPTRFDPTRPLSDNMAFGHGRHWCLGVPIAMAVLVNMFRPLLLQGPITARKGAPRTRFFMDYFAENFEISIGRNGP